MNGRGLRLETRWTSIARDRQCLGVDVCCIQETPFLTRAVNFVRGFVLYSASFDGRSRGVSWLVGKILNVAPSFVFAVPVCRLCELSVTIKDKPLRHIGVYATNDNGR